jgi:hypothetical protein
MPESHPVKIPDRDLEIVIEWRLIIFVAVICLKIGFEFSVQRMDIS